MRLTTERSRTLYARLAMRRSLCNSTQPQPAETSHLGDSAARATMRSASGSARAAAVVRHRQSAGRVSGSRFSGIAAISTARLTWPLSTSSLPAQRILLAQGFAERSLARSGIELAVGLHPRSVG